MKKFKFRLIFLVFYVEAQVDPKMGVSHHHAYKGSKRAYKFKPNSEEEKNKIVQHF
jgi:hypothetical protein